MQFKNDSEAFLKLNKNLFSFLSAVELSSMEEAIYINQKIYIYNRNSQKCRKKRTGVVIWLIFHRILRYLRRFLSAAQSY